MPSNRLTKMNVFTDRKARDKDKPWLKTKSFMFGGETITSVLKNNQANTLEPGASAMCLVVSPATGSFGDMGDTYWAQVYMGELIEVDGRDPFDAEMEDWALLQSQVVVDPMTAMGF